MPIVITDHDTERLVRRLADVTGATLDVAIADAVRARLVDMGRRPAPGASIADIQAYVKSLPIIDPRPGDEILYDEFGLPK